MEIRRPESYDQPAIANFFQALVAGGDSQTFHPHPFTASEASHITKGLSPKGLPTNDIFHFGFVRREAVAYGILRGWDEGFSEPSLGIAVHPRFRGQGLAGQMVRQLHNLARMRGATSVRLKVYRSNSVAIHFYKKLGYVLTDHDDSQWLGRLSLKACDVPDPTFHTHLREAG
jgi:GNAT superfamily N-acetyltransferase